MLEKMPRGLGHALRAGYEEIIAEDDAFAQNIDTIEAMTRHVPAKGVLVGAHERV